MGFRVGSSGVFVSSCDSSFVGSGAILTWMVWLMEQRFSCPSFSFLTPLNLLPTCSYWRGGKILLHAPSPGDISLALQHHVPPAASEGKAASPASCLLGPEHTNRS